MVLAFFSPGQGDPTRMQRRIAWQSDPDVPAVSGMVDFRSNAGPVAPSHLAVKPQVITGSPMEADQLDGKFDLANPTLNYGDIDAAGLAAMMVLGNALGRKTHTTPATGLERWRFGQLESDLASPCLTLLSDDDLGYPTRYASLRAAGFTLKAGPRQNASLDVPFAVGKHDYWSDGSQTAGSGSTVPILRHTSGAQVSTSTMSVFAKVVSDATDATVFKFAYGSSAGSFTGAPSVTCTKGQWTEILTATGGTTPLGRIGTYAESIEVYIPVGATEVTDDAFTWLQRRARWTPSLSVERRIAEVSTRLFVGDVGVTLARTHAEGGWTLQQAIAGAQRLEDTGGRQAIGTRRYGSQIVTLQVQRNLIDLDFQRLLQTAGFASFVIEGRSDIQIGTTGVAYGFRAVAPRMKGAGAFFSTPTGGGSPTEQITFTASIPESALTYAGETYSSDLTVEFENDIASW